MTLTSEELKLVEACWNFINTMQREDCGILPRSREFTPLESFLVLSYAQSQAGLFKYSNMAFGDKGISFLFPTASAMRDVSQEQWDDFAGRVSSLMRKITEG